MSWEGEFISCYWAVSKVHHPVCTGAVNNPQEPHGTVMIVQVLVISSGAVIFSSTGDWVIIVWVRWCLTRHLLSVEATILCCVSDGSDLCVVKLLLMDSSSGIIPYITNQASIIVTLNLNQVAILSQTSIFTLLSVKFVLGTLKSNLRQGWKVVFHCLLVESFKPVSPLTTLTGGIGDGQKYDPLCLWQLWFHGVRTHQGRPWSTPVHHRSMRSEVRPVEVSKKKILRGYQRCRIRKCCSGDHGQLHIWSFNSEDL